MIGCACFSHLKGHCHGDFVVLGQFFAEIITLKLYSNKMLLYSYDEDIKCILSERANHNEFREDLLKT